MSAHNIVPGAGHSLHVVTLFVCKPCQGRTFNVWFTSLELMVIVRHAINKTPDIPTVCIIKLFRP